MAAPQQKPRIVPELESEYREEEYQQPIGDPVPPDVYVNQATRPSGSSTGLIIAGLIVVFGILFALSFNWAGDSTAPPVTQNNTAPATPDPLAPVTPAPPAAEAPTPPATETAPQPSTTTP